MALVAVGLMWLAVAGMIAVVIRLDVPTPEELLLDVADRRALWIAANAVLIVQQAVLVLAAGGLVTSAGTTADNAVRGLLAIAGGALIGSGIFHGVLGAHLASKVGQGPLSPDVVDLSELVHALGDTCWFVGVGAITAATAAVSSTRFAGPLLKWLGAGAVVANLLQFGWFADHVFGVFAAPGTLLQAAWFVAAGTYQRRGQSPTRGRPQVHR